MPPGRVLGAQALLLATPFPRALLAEWPEPGGTASTRVGAVAARLHPGIPIPYRRPSLIEHTASSWAGVIHRAEVWEDR